MKLALLTVFAGVLGTVAAGSASAGPNPAVAGAETVAGPELDLSYRVAEGCMSRQVFEQEVFTRVRELHLELRPRIEVSIERLGDQYHAKLLFTRPGAVATTRELSAERCEEVASAMAVVVALAIDALVVPEVQPERRAAAKPSPPARPAAPASFAVGGTFVADLSLAPQVAWGGSVFGALELPKGGPAFRAQLTYRTPGEASASGRKFTVAFVGLGLEACPWVLASRALRLEPCVLLLTGRYSAEGTSGFTRSAERAVWWNSGGALLRGSLRLLGPWSWEAQAGVLVPFANQLSLVADAVDTGRTLPLFDVSPVSAEFGTGFKLDFP